MTENIGEPAGMVDGNAAKKDCGCGCGGGSGGCGDAAPDKAPVRRRFLTGGLSVSAFAATLASRRAFGWDQGVAGCTLSQGASPSYASHGHQDLNTCHGGKSFGFWKNHASCWIASQGPFAGKTKSYALSRTFSDVGADIIPGINSSLKLSCAILEIGGDNYDRQVACAVLNILASGVTGKPYATIAALAAAITSLSAHKSYAEIGSLMSATINSDPSGYNNFCSDPASGNTITCS
jgi:hypothetical protein